MITVDPAKTSSIASQLSSQDLRAGLKIISSLPTVVYMAGQKYPIDDIVNAIFISEYGHEGFTQFMRKFDSYETLEKKEFVAELLSQHCKS